MVDEQGENQRAGQRARSLLLSQKGDKSMRSVFLMLIQILFLISPFLDGQTVSRGDLAIEHTPILGFIYGETVEVRAKIKGQIERMIFYFRCEGISQFQVREMERRNGEYLFLFDTSLLPVLEFEYYLSAKIEDKTFNYPPEAPSRTIRVRGESREPLPEIPRELPSPEEEEQKFRLPLSINGNIQSKLVQKQEEEVEAEEPDERKIDVSGNLRFFPSYHRAGAISFELDSNFSYTNMVPEGEKRFDLSNMAVTLSRNNHTFRIGDINISESEYTVSGLGRRGMEYIFDNQKAYFHVFNVSSQQPIGFQGFGIPKSNLSIFGGAAGYNFVDRLSLKAIYVGGKDDPTQGINTGSSSYYQSRQGNVMAIKGEAELLPGKLNLKAEFARSEYDGDLADEIPTAADQAFSLGAGLTWGVLTFDGAYMRAGNEFNPIGFQSFTNDRKGYEAGGGLRIGIMNLTGSYNFQRDNVANDPSRLSTENRGGNFSISFTWTRVSLNFGYRRDKQRTLQDEMEVAGQDSLTNEYNGSLTLMLNNSASINMAVTNASLASLSFPEGDNSTFTLNIGGSFRGGAALVLNPVFGYSRALNKFTNEENIAYNSMITGELTLAPQILSLNFSGAYNHSRAISLVSDIYNATGGLNLYLDKLIKIGSVVLSVRGNYTLNKIGPESVSDYRVFLQLDFSF